MDIESTQDTRRHGRPFAPHNDMQNEEEELTIKFETSLNFENQIEPNQQNFKRYQGYNPDNAEGNPFSTPEKGTKTQNIGGRGYCLTTKSKVNRDIVNQDRFATPPRRPQRPTSKQLECFLREERDHNRRR